MYIGHAAIAIALKARRPDVSLLALGLAAYGPDWVDLTTMIPYARGGMAVYSHSLPAILLGAAVAALLYRVLARRPGAGLVALAWCSHWAADFITGVKPVVGSGWMVGLDVYHLPVADFAIELLILTIACADYAHVFAAERWQRRLVLTMWALLGATQGMMDVVVAHLDPSPWRPSLAAGPWRPHVTPSWVRPSADHSAWLLHSSPSLTREQEMSSNGPRGVVTLVCLTCGKEKFYTKDVPATVSCEQCGGTVFRTFATPTEPDDAAIDALEAQARSISYGDSSPDTTRDDVRDLDAL